MCERCVQARHELAPEREEPMRTHRKLIALLVTAIALAGLVVAASGSTGASAGIVLTTATGQFTCSSGGSGALGFSPPLQYGGTAALDTWGGKFKLTCVVSNGSNLAIHNLAVKGLMEGAFAITINNCNSLNGTPQSTTSSTMRINWSGIPGVRIAPSYLNITQITAQQGPPWPYFTWTGQLTGSFPGPSSGQATTSTSSGTFGTECTVPPNTGVASAVFPVVTATG